MTDIVFDEISQLVWLNIWCQYVLNEVQTQRFKMCGVKLDLERFDLSFKGGFVADYDTF